MRGDIQEKGMCGLLRRCFSQLHVTGHSDRQILDEDKVS